MSGFMLIQIEMASAGIGTCHGRALIVKDDRGDVFVACNDMASAAGV
jgi:hypothetical protein